MSEMSNVDNSFRTKLYNWRMANNLNQREAAVSLGCQQNQIWRWEQGLQNPRKATLDKLLPIIESVPAPAQEPVEEPWVPGVTEPDEPVYTARPKTFRERMEQMHGGPEKYFEKTTRTLSEMEEDYQKYKVSRELAEKMENNAQYIEEPLPPVAKPKATELKLAKVIGFLECLALYAAEGVAEPLGEQIETLKSIAEELGA